MTATDWVSVAEAARRLNIDRHTLYDAAARGEVPARRIGRSLRVPAWWVDAGGPEASNGQTTPDVEGLTAEFTRAVLAALGDAFTNAARATTPDAESGAVLTMLTRDDEEGRHGR